jgi:hypothetical protein
MKKVQELVPFTGGEEEEHEEEGKGDEWALKPRAVELRRRVAERRGDHETALKRAGELVV